MSRDQVKAKFEAMDRKTLALIFLLVGSGGGSGITALRGPDTEAITAEMDAIHQDVVGIKIELARQGQKLDDYILHARDNRQASVSTKAGPR